MESLTSLTLAHFARGKDKKKRKRKLPTTRLGVAGELGKGALLGGAILGGSQIIGTGIPALTDAYRYGVRGKYLIPATGQLTAHRLKTVGGLKTVIPLGMLAGATGAGIGMYRARKRNKKEY